jgi:hypothetical protein
MLCFTGGWLPRFFRTMDLAALTFELWILCLSRSYHLFITSTPFCILLLLIDKAALPPKYHPPSLLIPYYDLQFP